MRFGDRRPLREHGRGQLQLPSGPDLHPERCGLDLPANERIVRFGKRGRKRIEHRVHERKLYRGWVGERIEHGVDERSLYCCWFWKRGRERLENGVNERSHYYRFGCERRNGPVRFRRGRPLREREPRRVRLPSGPDLQGEHFGADLPAVKR
jgi:hypothetical protein